MFWASWRRSHFGCMQQCHPEQCIIQRPGCKHQGHNGNHAVTFATSKFGHFRLASSRQCTCKPMSTTMSCTIQRLGICSSTCPRYWSGCSQILEWMFSSHGSPCFNFGVPLDAPPNATSRGLLQSGTQCFSSATSDANCIRQTMVEVVFGPSLT